MLEDRTLLSPQPVLQSWSVDWAGSAPTTGTTNAVVEVPAGTMLTLAAIRRNEGNEDGSGSVAARFPALITDSAKLMAVGRICRMQLVALLELTASRTRQVRPT